jgi:arginase family enzyme
MPRSEYHAIVQMGGIIFTAEDVHRLGAVEVARRAADHASRGTDTIYLTLDIDILDPGYVPGRSAVDPIGVTPVQLREMLQVLAPYPLGAMDLNEVNPRLDVSGRSISLAAEMAMTLITSGKLSTP